MTLLESQSRFGLNYYGSKQSWHIDQGFLIGNEKSALIMWHTIFDYDLISLACCLLYAAILIDVCLSALYWPCLTWDGNWWLKPIYSLT